MILSAIFVVIVWTFFFIVAAILAKRLESKKWFRVYDNCGSYDFNHQYLFRMIYSRSKEQFDRQFRLTTFTIGLIDSNGATITEFSVPGEAMKRSVVTAKGHDMVQIVIYRNEELQNITKIMVNHNGRGKLYISTAELQNIKDSKAQVAFIDKYIGYLTPTRAINEQCFSAATQQIRKIDYIPYSPLALSSIDYAVFIWMAINLIMVLAVGVIVCLNSKKLKLVCSSYHKDYMASLLTGLMSSVLTFLLFAALILIHRFVVKEYLIKFQQSFYFFYLALVFMCGLVAGVGAYFMVSQMKDKSNDHKFWIYSSIVGFIVFTVFWLPLSAAIGLLIGFFKDPALNIEEQVIAINEPIIKEKIRTEKTNVSKKTVVPQKKVEDKKEAEDKKKVDRKDSDESLGNRYYEQLMKGKGKVKSISKY